MVKAVVLGCSVVLVVRAETGREVFSPSGWITWVLGSSVACKIYTWAKGLFLEKHFVEFGGIASWLSMLKYVIVPFFAFI